MPVRSALCESPLCQIGGKGSEEPDGSRLASLRCLDPAERQCPLDEDRPLANIGPGQGESLTRSKAGIRQHGDEDGITHAAVGEQTAAHPRDVFRSQRPDDALPALRRLAHRAARVCRYPAPLDRTLEHSLENRQNFAHRRVAEALDKYDIDNAVAFITHLSDVLVRVIFELIGFDGQYKPPCGAHGATMHERPDWPKSAALSGRLFGYVE